MRAIVVTRTGGPEVLEARDEPDPQPGAGQVLVELEAAGVNFRDIYEREGAGGYTNEPPFVAGAGGAGAVTAGGGGAGGVSGGDPAAWGNAPGGDAQAAGVEVGRGARGPG